MGKFQEQLLDDCLKEYLGKSRNQFKEKFLNKGFSEEFRGGIPNEVPRKISPVISVENSPATSRDI